MTTTVANCRKEPIPRPEAMYQRVLFKNYHECL